MREVKVVILGGGNVGDVEARLQQAEQLLQQRVGNVCRSSDPMRTLAWGFEAEEPFTNRAFVIETTLSAEQVLEHLLTIERELGRNREEEYREKMLRGEAYASRMIDLDILLYGEERIVTPHLQVPHPRVLQREFALAPLEQVMGWSREQSVAKIMDIATK